MIAVIGWIFVVGGTLAILWVVGKVSEHQYDRHHERLPEPDHRVLRHHTVDDWIASHGRNRWSQHTAGDDTD